MSLYQKIAVGYTVCLCMLDGFDVFAITFAAPAIKAAWKVGPAQIGLALSSGLLGMAAGSLLIAPAADLIGRRRLVFISLALMILSTLRTAFTHSIPELMVTRFFTGLGIGAMIAVITSLAAEYANSRNRDFCLTMMGAGFPFGGVIGGLLAAFLLSRYGWPALFLASGSLGTVLLIAAWIGLPEPIAPMIARPRGDTLVRVNAYLAKCGMATIAALPPPPQNARTSPFRALFQPGVAGATLLVTSIYFLHVITLFFVQSWVPSLIVSEGFSPARAPLVAVWVNIGGITGGLLLGATSMRFGLKRLVVIALVGGAVLTAVFGSIPPNFLLLAIGAAAMGFFLQSGMMGLYAVIGRTFPAHMRASGTGLAIGVGRIGSAIGPALAGQLLTVGLHRNIVALVMAVPSMIAAALLLRFRVVPPDTP